MKNRSWKAYHISQHSSEAVTSPLMTFFNPLYSWRKKKTKSQRPKSIRANSPGRIDAVQTVCVVDIWKVQSASEKKKHINEQNSCERRQQRVVYDFANNRRRWPGSRGHAKSGKLRIRTRIMEPWRADASMTTCPGALGQRRPVQRGSFKELGAMKWTRPIEFRQKWTRALKKIPLKTVRV